MKFYKYQGAGNDFILVDNREVEHSSLSHELIEKMCDRRFGIGADGLMLLNNKDGYDFEMIYFNSDGHVGSMCGNGGRCIVRFAYDIGIRKNEYKFLASDGDHLAYINADDNEVSLKMKDVDFIEEIDDHFVLNTGSPHYVVSVDALDGFNVFEEGKKIRYSDEFKKEGINVNFVEVIANDKLKVRTYERGVEDETYACGTGVTAAALVFYHNENGFNSVDINVLGGNLNVSFTRGTDGANSDIWLKGPANKVFEGNIVI